jgi:hypothetical protein
LGVATIQDVPQLVELLKVLFGIEQDFMPIRKSSRKDCSV